MWQQRVRAWFDSIRARLARRGARTTSDDADEYESRYETIVVGQKGRFDLRRSALPITIGAIAVLSAVALVTHPPVQGVGRGEVGVRINRFTGTVSEWHDGSVVRPARPAPDARLLAARPESTAPAQMRARRRAGAAAVGRGPLARRRPHGALRDRSRASRALAAQPARRRRRARSSSRRRRASSTRCSRATRCARSSRPSAPRSSSHRDRAAAAARRRRRRRCAACRSARSTCRPTTAAAWTSLLAEELAARRCATRSTSRKSASRRPSSTARPTRCGARSAPRLRRASRSSPPRAQEEAMKHVLPFKQRQIEQRQLEAEAEKVTRIKAAEASAAGAPHRGERRGRRAPEARRRRGLSPRARSARSNAEQMAREGALITRHPLLIQKTMADKLSDKIQVIIAPPPAPTAASSAPACSAARGAVRSRRAAMTPSSTPPPATPRRRREHRRTMRDVVHGLTVLIAALAAALATVAGAATLALGASSRRARPAPRRRRARRRSGDGDHRSSCATRPRCAPRRATRRQQQAVLWQGEVLEVRGERLDYLQVYDHRRERGGFVRASQVAPRSRSRADDAPELLALVCASCASTPGSEALGIGFAAAYLQAAPAEALNGDAGIEAFDALGTIADRLARRASSAGASSKAAEAALSAHLDVARRYGVHFASFERDGSMQICYDGDAFRRVLAMRPSRSSARAPCSALTRPECVDPALGRSRARRAGRVARRRARPRRRRQARRPTCKNRVAMRRAGVWSATRLPARAPRRRVDAEATAAGAARARPRPSWPASTRASSPTRTWPASTTPRCASTRRAGPPTAERRAAPGRRRRVAASSTPGEPGRNLRPAGRREARRERAAGAPLHLRHRLDRARRRSIAKATRSPLAVQPIEAWRELWLFRKTERAAGACSVLPPATTAPGIWLRRVRRLGARRPADAGRARSAWRGPLQAQLRGGPPRHARHRAAGRRPRACSAHSSAGRTRRGSARR